MFASGRPRIAAIAAVCLFGSLTALVWTHPIGRPASAASHATTRAAMTQPDFAPIDDATAAPPSEGVASSLNVYQATMGGGLSPTVAGMPLRVYVPNSASGTVDVIDPATYRVVAHYPVGAIPHHVAPAWDLTRLYVDDEGSGVLSVIDPRTSLPVNRIAVPDP